MNGIKYLLHLHYAFLNGLLSLFRLTLYGPLPQNASRVLVVRKGNIGDIVCSIPAFQFIQHFFSNAQLDLLTTHGAISKVGASGVLDGSVFHRVYEYQQFTTKELFKLVKQNKYDAVIELPADVDTFLNQLRNMIFFRLMGITNGGGWSISRTNFLSKLQLRLLHFDTEQIRLRKVLAQNGIETTTFYNNVLYSNLELENVKNKLGNVPSSNKMVAIAVGAKLDKKKWPLLYFKEVIAFLHQHKYTVIAIGDAQDKLDVQTLKEFDVLNVCDELSIRESAALLSLCDFTVCNDSGPMHLSYSVGTPVFAVFSARNYVGKWYPPVDGKNQLFINYAVPCAGCLNKPCNDNICMKQIKPDTVIQSIKQFIES